MPKPPWFASQRGTSLAEVLIASVVAGVMAAGFLASFVAARRLASTNARLVEASGYAEQTLERFRNMIACDTGGGGEWFDTTCAPIALPTGEVDPLPVGSELPGGATRTHTVVPEDCDGVGGPGDCYRVIVNVQWTPPS